MQGTLFKYGPGSAHIAFKSATTAKQLTHSGQLHLVLVGGLTDGLLFAPYCQKLAAAADKMGWSLVQAQLTSSYQGWGLASLDQDASELRLLSKCLSEQHDCSAWVLMGHSTGCQDAVRYVQKYRNEDSKLAGVILQAPVSDREYLSMYPSWEGLVQPAQALVASGRGDEVVCRAVEFDGAAVTARRFLSLYCCGGDDDMFSTDLSLQQLQELPCCILQSGADEAVPELLRDDGSTNALGKRMVQAIRMGSQNAATTGSTDAITSCAEGEAGATATAAAGSTNDGGATSSSSADAVELHVIEGAGHACAGHEADVVKLVCQFLQRLPLPVTMGCAQ